MLHIFRQVLFLFFWVPSKLSHNLCLILLGVKQNKNFELKMVHQKECNFFKSTNFPIMRLTPWKSGMHIDVKGMDVAQPIWLSGCPKKGSVIEWRIFCFKNCSDLLWEKNVLEIDYQIVREPSKITFAFFGIWPRTYPP